MSLRTNVRAWQRAVCQRKIGKSLLGLSLGLSLGLTFPSVPYATTLPTGGVVVSGDVVVQATSSNLMCLLQRTPQAIMYWRSFDIPEDARLIVDQGSPQSVLLNRVTGDTPSLLAGDLRANGAVWLVNPNGIEITDSGSVRAGGFLASTLLIDDKHLQGFEVDGGARAYAAVLSDAKRGDVHPGEEVQPGESPVDVFASPSAGSVRHGGSTVVRRGGQVTLIGAALANTGKIFAEDGRIALLGWRDSPIDQAVTSTGLLRSDTGAISITALDGNVSLQGRIDASSTSVSGGSVEVHAPNITVSHATIDVSGRDNGGSVALVAQSDDEPPASLSVAPDAVLRADSLSHGDGGAISVVSSGGTTFDGHASAKGASNVDELAAGSAVNAAASPRDDSASESPMAYRRGGFVNIVGADGLDVGGMVDVAAPANHGPGCVHFVGGSTAIIDRQSAMEQRRSGSEQPAPAHEGTICADVVSRILEHANVTVSAGGDRESGSGVLRIAGPITWTADTALSLKAADHVEMDARLSATGNGASLIFNNDRTVFDKGRVCLKGKDAALSIGGIDYTLLRDKDLLTLFARRGNGYFVLASNVNLKDEAMVPIVEKRAAHFRRLDGMGNTISGISILQPDGGNVGLFGELSGHATLANLALDKVHVTGRFSVGAVVGYLRDGSQLSRVRVRRADIQATPTGNFGLGAGGLVGSAGGQASIVLSDFRGRVSGHASVGGVAGQMNGGARMADVRAVGHVAGFRGVGGVVGAMGPETTLARGNWWGDVTGIGDGNHAIGGVVGELRRASLTHGIASGDIQGDQDVGGLVGMVSGGTVTQCTVACHVVGQENVGGVAGMVSNAARITFNQSPGYVTATRKGGTLIGSFISGMLRENQAAEGLRLDGVLRSIPIGFAPQANGIADLNAQCAHGECQ